MVIYPQSREENTMEVDRLVRVSAIINIFDTDVDSREQRFLKKERNTDSDIDFGKIFKSACEDLKNTG